MWLINLGSLSPWLNPAGNPEITLYISSWQIHGPYWPASENPKGVSWEGGGYLKDIQSNPSFFRGENVDPKREGDLEVGVEPELLTLPSAHSRWCSHSQPWVFARGDLGDCQVMMRKQTWSIHRNSEKQSTHRRWLRVELINEEVTRIPGTFEGPGVQRRTE